MPRSSDTLALLQVRYNRHIALKKKKKNHTSFQALQVCRILYLRFLIILQLFQNQFKCLFFFFIILAGLTVPPSLGKVCILVCLYLYKLLTTCCLMKQILKNVCVNLLFRLKASWEQGLYLNYLHWDWQNFQTLRSDWGISYYL